MSPKPFGFVYKLLIDIGVLFLVSACLDSSLDSVMDATPSGTVCKLNKNVSGLRKLASACLKVDSVAVFSIDYNDDGSALYWLSMKEEGDIELYSEIISEDIRVPELSMGFLENDFYWSIDGVFITDVNGNRIAVTDLSKSIAFFLYDDMICCKVNDIVVGEYAATRTDYLAKDVSFEYDVDNDTFNFRLSSGYQATLPTISEFRLFDENVPNRTFYKDVFLDAGVYLRSRKSLNAANYLGLSLEGISFPYSNPTAEEKSLQKDIICGDSKDLNGRLLYPDGQPRYKFIFVNGGNSRSHGQSLGKQGLETIRSFVEKGGSYVGVCAGAFLASNGYDGQADYPYYLSIWPGMMNHTGLNNTYTGMYIEQDNPLFQYYDFGGDHYVDSVYHSGGGYAVNYPAGTEVLARFSYSRKKTVHEKPSIWSYKRNSRCGRIVITGSHPEEAKDGERRDLIAAMMRYAMDGMGVVSIKGFLKNGVERVMDKKTSDNNPAYTRIGDLQTHHFATYIPSNAKNIRVEVSSNSKCDLALMINQGSYAFFDEAKYRSSISGPSQQLFFSSIQEGIWFIGVQCLTTVTVRETDYGQEYSGNLEVLNGIPYKISISWE